jgi:CheY-like chemotaxis protein
MESRAMAACKHHILIVEDSVPLRRLLKTALEAEGFEVSAARRGEEAIEICRLRADIALVLSDVHMPGLSGPETMAALHAIRPDLRCCFMTGDAVESKGDRLLRLGAVAVFEKPFVVTELVSMIACLTGMDTSPEAA